MPKLANMKHEFFAQNLVKHKGNKTLAYKETYPTAKRSTCGAKAPQLAKRPEVAARIQEIMDRKGMTVEYLVNKHLDTISDNPTDSPVRYAAIRDGLKLHGYTGEKAATTIDARTVNINGSVEPGTVERVAGLLSMLNDKLGFSKYAEEREESGES